MRRMGQRQSPLPLEGPIVARRRKRGGTGDWKNLKPRVLTTHQEEGPLLKWCIWTGSLPY